MRRFNIIFSRVHTNDENSPNVTWANIFLRVNYYFCRGFECNITFVANQTCLILGNGWMDELGFYVPSTVFQSFRDDGRVNMIGSVQ